MLMGRQHMWGHLGFGLFAMLTDNDLVASTRWRHHCNQSVAVRYCCERTVNVIYIA